MIDELQSWVGKQESNIDHVTIPMVRRLSALLDREDPMPRLGDELPVGWHTTLYPRIVRQSQIGADGHPIKGDFLPPVPLPRRMFGGRRTKLLAPLRVGDEVDGISTIKSITTKDGRSGQMVFVTVGTDMFNAAGLAISQEQDVIYRGELTSESKASGMPIHAPCSALWKRHVTPDAVMSFRYSAIAFNGHRIHYDYPYVTKVEGYPGLIVSGGLTTLFMYELAREHADRPLKALSTRNIKPLFVDRPISIYGGPLRDDTLALWVCDDTGAIAVSGEGTLS